MDNFEKRAEHFKICRSAKEKKFCRCGWKMTRVIKIFILSAMVFAAAHAAAKDRSEYYRIIDQSYKTKNYGPSIAALEQAVREYPDEADFASNLMFMYCHTKRFDDARRVGDAAIKRFPDHGYTRNAYRWALTALGWEYFERKDLAASLKVFECAYGVFPDDSNAVNGYGCVLRERGEYRRAAAVLEKGLTEHPDYGHIRKNLSWTYLGIADDLIKENRHDEAGPCLKRFFDLGDSSDPNVYTAYLYRCSRLRLFDDGKTQLAAAIGRFTLTGDIYKSGFWLYFNSAETRRAAGDFEGAVPELKALCAFAVKKDMPYENGMTYHHFSVSAAHTGIHSMIEAICPYWRPFAAAEKSRADRLLNILQKDIPPELSFVAHNLRGHILYREGRVVEAGIELDKAYQSALLLPFAAKFRYTDQIAISLPVRGIYGAANCLSRKYITHMGLNRHCYDFFGTDAGGNHLKRSVEPGKSTLDDWLGFGSVIYSPVDGIVMRSAGGHRDDPPFPAAQGEANYLQILSNDGKIYNFVHLMKDSLTVKQGERVRAGQKIAKLGNSSSTSPHLHFGVYSRDWIITYPVYFINYHRLSEGPFEIKGMPGADKDIAEIIDAK